MVKVKCIMDYFDKQLEKDVTILDDAFLVSPERAEQLVAAKVCKIIEVIPDEPVKKTKKKK